MQPIVVRSDRGKLVVFVIGALGFVLGGVFIIAAGGSLVVGLMSICFFGACGAVFVRQLFDARARLVIDDAGVLDRALKVGVIPWEDILDAQPSVVGGQPFVALRLNNHAHYIDRLGSVHRRLVQLNEAMGFSAVNLNVAGADVDTHSLAALIAAEAERRRKPKTEPYRD